MLSSKISPNENLLLVAVNNANSFITMTLLNQMRHPTDAVSFDLVDVFRKTLDSTDERISMMLLKKIQQLSIELKLSCNEAIVCIQCQKYNMVRYCLLYQFIQVQHRDFDQSKLLKILIEHDLINYIELLVDHYGLNLRSCIDNEPAIFTAIKENNSRISGYFLSNGTDIDCKNNDGKYLIEVCIEKKWFLHVSFIIKAGFTKFFHCKKLFQTLCHSAVKHNSTLVFNILVTNYYASVIQNLYRKNKRGRLQNPNTTYKTLDQPCPDSSS